MFSTQIMQRDADRDMENAFKKSDPQQQYYLDLVHQPIKNIAYGAKARIVNRVNYYTEERSKTGKKAFIVSYPKTRNKQYNFKLAKFVNGMLDAGLT